MTTATQAAHLRQVAQLAGQLMAEHAPAGWSWGWDSARRRAGCTNYTARKITLARDVMAHWQMDDCRDTILHEIAHAIAGNRAGHGPQWQTVCVRIGARPARCWKPTADRPLPPSRYVGTCPAGHAHKTDRKPNRLSSCAKCAPYRFSHDHLITWEKRAA